MEKEYLGRALTDGPAPPAPPTTRRDHVGVHPQADGRFYVGAGPIVGRVSGSTLSGIADLAESVGSDRVRFTVEQKILVLDVAADQVDRLSAGLSELGLEVAPSAFRRGAMACTGLEFCKLAIVETKGRTRDLVLELEDRLPSYAHPLTVHVNGCPNSCARIQVADLGFKGQIVTTPDGEQVEGFQVHLGGGLGLDAGFGRKLRGHKVTAAELPDYVERVAQAFDAQREADETFPQWVARADEGVLR